MNAVAQSLDRRASIRFPMSLEAQLKGRGLNACATTVDLSTRGLLLMTTAQVQTGARVETHVKWPFALERCDLKLVIMGEVVWTRGLLVAIKLIRHEFRTVARKCASSSQEAQAHNFGAVQST